LEPTNLDALLNLGVAYYRHGQLEDAIKQFKKVLLFSPHLLEGHNNLGLAYAKNAQLLRGALKLHERYDERAPHALPSSPRATLMLQALEQAVYHLGRVLDMRPENPIIHSNFGLALYFKGEVEKSMFEWMEVTRLSPAYARVREATRLSAYDDSEMVIRPLDRDQRVLRFPPKAADFRGSFEFAFDERAFELDIPWPDIAKIQRWIARARKSQPVPGRPQTARPRG